MVSDLDIEEINKSIVAFFNEDAELSEAITSEEVKQNVMVVEIIGKRRASGFVIRGNKAEIIKGTVENPTVKFTVSSKDTYYLMIEDILNGANIRGLLTAMILSHYPKMVMEPPVEKAGMYHLESLVQIFELWSEKMAGGV